MVSTSGLSIRRLISQRRPGFEDEDGIYTGPGSVQRRVYDHDGGKGPWNPRRRKQSPAPIVVGSPAIHDILRPLPPIPNETRRSSASSSCSCERHTDTICPRLTERRKSPLCPPPSKNGRSEESLQPSKATNHGAGECLSQPSFQLRPLKTPRTRLAEHSSGTSLGLMDTSSHHRDNTAKRPEELLRNQASSESLSENVQHLIQETDEAFRAVGNALAEARLISFSFDEPRSIPTPDISPILQRSTESLEVSPILEATPPPTPPPKPTPPLRAIPPRKPTPTPSLPTVNGRPRQTLPVLVNSPRHSPAVVRVQRTRSNKAKKVKPMKPQRKSAAVKQATKSGSRWTLTENVSELLSSTGKLFHKIEADEMLTPSQLEAYKLRRLSQIQAEKSTETLENEAVDTPVDPFHLDDLPFRIGSAGIKLNAEDSSSTLFSEDIARQDFSLEGGGSHADSGPQLGASAALRPLVCKNNSYPAPAIRHSQRAPPRRQMTALPSIPEASASATPVQDEELFLGNSPLHAHSSVADSDYVFFQASGCTGVAPGFRHGPIRLAKADLLPDVKIGADEGLDWTAFQMAILGGAGDWYSDSDDTIRRREAEEVNQLVEWWNDWGFPSPGSLVTQDIDAPSPTSTTSGEDLSDISYSEIETDNPYSPHHRWHSRFESVSDGRHAGATSQYKPYVPSNYYAMSMPVRKDMPIFEEKECVVRRDSSTSLPPSPMLDLRVIRSEDGQDVDVVPMGYNLGHDLGDFLKWEAEHAYAGDFSELPGM
ncbi:hypothetical protein F4780DRAFT_87334 [Xylariomycetidae sp. FL0641]|nr:hypothetical protein F4780DRAFT_87334 [Xylariomycetidae sp. FL0641]